MEYDSWPFAPTGNIKVTYAWSPVVTEFEFGNRQYNRTQIHAKKSYELKVSGELELMDSLVDFYERHKGRSVPFYVTYYDDVRELCFFGAPLQITYFRELHNIVGGEAKITIEVAWQTTNYPSPSINDMLPLSRGKLEYSNDWNTTIYTTSSTQRRLKNQVPNQTVKVHFEGEREDRDKLINLFNSHEMVPLKLPAYRPNHDDFYWVRFPTTITIEDKIAFEDGKKQIVGFSSDIEFDVHVDRFY